jgi:hypothetical protein
MWLAAGDDVQSIALLTEEIKSDEVDIRIKAMRRVKSVAQALGVERRALPLLRGASSCG